MNLRRMLCNIRHGHHQKRRIQRANFKKGSIIGMSRCGRPRFSFALT